MGDASGMPSVVVVAVVAVPVVLCEATTSFSSKSITSSCCRCFQRVFACLVIDSGDSQLVLPHLIKHHFGVDQTVLVLIRRQCVQFVHHEDDRQPDRHRRSQSHPLFDVLSAF